MPAFPRFVRPILNRGGRAYAASGWGRPRGYRAGIHAGLDFPAPIDTPVYAAAAGKVAFAGAISPGGNAISVEHAPGLKTRYLHLDRFAVRVGQVVVPGQLLGWSGASGISRSEAHLHFDVRGSEVWLAEYVRRFGRPTPWPAECKAGGCGIPAEPFVPVDDYAPKVVADAKEHGVPLYGQAVLVASAYQASEERARPAIGVKLFPRKGAIVAATVGVGALVGGAMVFAGRAALRR